MAMAPIEVQSWSSNTGAKVTPPSVDFHTPPLAPPTQTMVGSPGTETTVPMRPLHTAGPMLRNFRPATSDRSMAGTAAAGAAAGGGSCANKGSDSTAAMQGREIMGAEPYGARPRDAGARPRESPPRRAGAVAA